MCLLLLLWLLLLLLLLLLFVVCCSWFVVVVAVVVVVVVVVGVVGVVGVFVFIVAVVVAVVVICFCCSRVRPMQQVIVQKQSRCNKQPLFVVAPLVLLIVSILLSVGWPNPATAWWLSCSLLSYQRFVLAVVGVVVAAADK
ncbi:unnamed protein product [Polarella glacialis]|uniref:Uncharacterized protein n=1 Tax=Polarella glacialis TaxID=89957 RepID=A0A813FFC9_POLGL|nr:unnamed protein product [Polarella glacialis]